MMIYTIVHTYTIHNHTVISSIDIRIKYLNTNNIFLTLLHRNIKNVQQEYYDKSLYIVK